MKVVLKLVLSGALFSAAVKLNRMDFKN